MCFLCGPWYKDGAPGGAKLQPKTFIIIISKIPLRRARSLMLLYAPSKGTAGGFYVWEHLILNWSTPQSSKEQTGWHKVSKTPVVPLSMRPHPTAARRSLRSSKCQSVCVCVWRSGGDLTSSGPRDIIIVINCWLVLVMQWSWVAHKSVKGPLMWTQLSVCVCLCEWQKLLTWSPFLWRPLLSWAWLCWWDWPAGPPPPGPAAQRSAPASDSTGSWWRSRLQDEEKGKTRTEYPYTHTHTHLFI